MRYLVISIALILFSSCSLQTTKGLLEQKPKKDFVINSYFADTAIDYIYKAKININENKFGGILIIKKIQENEHRIVFTTEFGNKIFDFEFINDTFKVNYILDKINKKIIINLLKKDFHLLVNESNLIEKQYLTDSETVYQTKLNKKYNYYFVSNENTELKKIMMASKRKEKLQISFNKINNKIANEINISHQNFEMNIDLIYINN
jgi:hypothetical protein